jgi:molecular chaperone HscB
VDRGPRLRSVLVSVENSTVSGPTHFERLALPQRFAVDAAEVERNYLARSRELHPDFHQLAASSEQRASMELSAALNEAYATLRQPFRRAEYLLTLLGGPSAAEHKQMEPAFLEEMLELRMEIEELREAGSADSPARESMARQLNERLARLRDALSAAFEQLEPLPANDARRQAALIRSRQLLNAAKYVEGLLRDLRAD